MKSRSPSFQDSTLKIVGSTSFGRYPKISVEQTFNMIISDNFLVDYAGYEKAIADINPNGVGRGIYHSTKQNCLFICIYNIVYKVFPNLTVLQIGTIDTFSGDVFFAEDAQGSSTAIPPVSGHVAICDKDDIWIYTEMPYSFIKATVDGSTPLDFRPGYVAFHNGRFLSVDLNSSSWRLSDPLAGNATFPFDTQHVGTFQTKPDIPVAALAFPGLGNIIFIMGSTVTELWNDVGAALFPYQRSTGVNIDYGCANADTIAHLDTMVCWLGINDLAGPVIFVSQGGMPDQISNDGINFKLASLKNPRDSHGFMFKQDGHIFYQLVFPSDNFSLTYDFNTQKFFTVTDTYMNYHIAKRVAFFNTDYYFVSLNDSSLYRLSSTITTFAGDQIPRVRVLPTYRLPNTAPFVVNNISFPIEQGVDDAGIYNTVQSIVVADGGSGYTFADVIFEGGNGNGATATATISSGVITAITVVNPGLGYNYAPILSIIGDGEGAEAISIINQIMPRVDLSVSYDGGYQFSNYDGMELNVLGKRKNRFIYYNLGWCNEFTCQFRFWSYGRFVVSDGNLSVYQ